MYDGIFEDVEHVKIVLASHGHESVDETLVFELLEDLKVKEHVIKVLLGTRLKPKPNSSSNSNSNSNSLDNSWSPDRSVTLDGPTSAHGGGDSCYFSNTIEDSDDDLEVLEDNSANGIRKNVKEIDNEAVDLTMEDNRSSSASSSEKFNNQDAKKNSKDLFQPLVDLTKESLVCKQPSFENENSKDTNKIKVDDQDGNNSATDYESEMDDYYNRHDNSEESEGFDESDDKVSPAVSPELRVCENFEIQRNNDVLTVETGENRMEEMLEENNNDPNNNLEDIEVMEQNNASAATTTQNLNIQKESTEERAASPKPGCSKDSYYAGSDFCSVKSGNGTSINRNEKFNAGKRSIARDVFENEDFLSVNRVRPSDAKIEQDLSMIKKILPQCKEARIMYALMENKEAINRVEIALWELLPEDKPAPVFHPKRKKEEDNCPAPVKKFITDIAPRVQKSNSSSEDECTKMEVESVAPAAISGIIKPALLNVSHSKKTILKPPKLELPNLRPVSPPSFSVPKNKSIVTLKPSILEHLHDKTTQNKDSSEAEISKKKPDLITNAKAISKEKQPVDSNVYKTGAIPKIPKPSVPTVPKEGERKSKDAMQAKADNIVAPSKLTIRIEQPVNGGKPPRYKIVDKTAAKGKEELPKLDTRKTGAISKTSTVVQQVALPRKDVDKSRAAKLKRTADVVKATADAVKTMKAEYLLQVQRRAANHGGIHPAQPYPDKVKPPASYGVSENPNNAGSSARGITLVPPAPNYLSESNVKLAIPEVAGASGSRIDHPPKMERHDARWNIVAIENQTNNALHSQIVQRVGNMQFTHEIIVGNGVMNNAQIPKIEKRPEVQYHANKIQGKKIKVSVINNGLGAAGPVQQIHPPRIEKPDVAPPKELFNPLINMFPDVDPNHIADLCISAKERNQTLESLVEMLLISGMLYPRIVNPEPEPQETNPDTQYENLQGIFPDAHPEYLRGIAEQYYNNPEAMKDFVQAQLENPDYPTMADYLKKIKITEQIKQYTVEFSAEKFLQIFPDPIAHFENPNRIGKYNVIAFEFLKNHFRMNRVITIQRAYRFSEHPYHTSLTAKSLEAIGPDMKSRRFEKPPVPTEDIPLLQEFAFIRHKAKIQEYITAQKLKEKEEFQRLKENNELLECQCCYDGECMPSKCLTCSEGHVFCINCIKLGSATKIGEGQTQFPCFVDCKGEFMLPVLQRVLEPTMFSILLRKRQEEEVKAAGLEGLVSCPFCHFASIPPAEDKVFKCLNPECMKETCRLCKELNHVPLRCDEVIKGEEARHYLEEKMTEALVRKCYRCSRPFFKDEGCNKMTCPCGAMTCYICGEPVKDYRHFNGQGSDRMDLCPLWSDNQILNAQTVRVVAEAAQKEILQKNPNLKIDAKALMPALPQATRGPHQDIANAHVLPVQARRV